jgi:hypothetical protein
LLVSEIVFFVLSEGRFVTISSVVFTEESITSSFLLTSFLLTYLSCFIKRNFQHFLM